MAAGAVQLKLRYEGFETLTRQMPVPRQTRESEPIYAAGVALLRKTLVRDRAVRLIGLTAINLTDVQQLTLFDEPDKTDRITKSIDAVRERFGEKAITRARLIGHGDGADSTSARSPRCRPIRTLDKSNTCSYASLQLERLFGASGRRREGVVEQMALTKITPTPARVQWDRRLARPSTVRVAGRQLTVTAPRRDARRDRRLPRRSRAAHHLSGRDRCRPGLARLRRPTPALVRRRAGRGRLANPRFERLGLDDPERSVAGLNPSARRRPGRSGRFGPGAPACRRVSAMGPTTGDRPKVKAHARTWSWIRRAGCDQSTVA